MNVEKSLSFLLLTQFVSYGTPILIEFYAIKAYILWLLVGTNMRISKQKLNVLLYFSQSDDWKCIITIIDHYAGMMNVLLYSLRELFEANYSLEDCSGSICLGIAIQ